MSKTEIAWAAGLFDGEGTAATAKNGKYLNINLSVYQSGTLLEPPQVLTRFQSAVGAGKIHGPHVRPSGFRKKPMWVYSVQNRPDFKLVTDKLWPFLSNVKKDQITKVFEKLEAHKCLTT